MKALMNIRRYKYCCFITAGGYLFRQCQLQKSVLSTVNMMRLAAGLAVGCSCLKNTLCVVDTSKLLLLTRVDQPGMRLHCIPARANHSSPPLLTVLCWTWFSMARLIHTAIYFVPFHALPGLECSVNGVLECYDNSLE